MENSKKSSGNSPLDELGKSLNSKSKIAGGNVIFYERGFTYLNTKQSTETVVVGIEPPLLGNPAIVTPTKKDLPVQVFASNADLKLMGGNTVILKALEGRFFLQEVGGETRIPILIKTGSGGTRVRVRPPGRPVPPPPPGKTGEEFEQHEITLVWEPEKPMKDRTLHDLVFKMDSDHYFHFSPHSIYARESWKDFGLIHATDIHVAQRNDKFKKLLKEAKKKYNRTDLDEGIANLNNWNDAFRDLIRYANFLHKKGLLDGVIATGDIVDYQFEEDEDRSGGGNFEYLKKLILGQVQYPDGNLQAEELKVPIFTVLGNHDYRTYAYKIFFGVEKAQITLHTIKQYGEFNLTELEARAIQDGRPPETDGNTSFNPGKPSVSTSDSAKMVESDNPDYYFQYFNAEKSYTAKLGRHRLVMLDSGQDTGLPKDEGGAIWTAMGNAGEDSSTAYSGAPNSVGFDLGHLEITNAAQRDAKEGGLVIVGTHSPLVFPKGNEFPHYFRETEHPTADENEVANFLRRQVPILPSQSETLDNKTLVKRVKRKFKDWPLTGTPHFKTGDHKNLLDFGVSRGHTEQFLKMCAGLKLGASNDPVRPIDLILCGHKHTRAEIRLKWDKNSKELQYFFDFYTENPTDYYSSVKYEHDFGGKTRVYTRVREGAKPNGNPGKLFDDFWGEVQLLSLPPYADPLEKSKKPADWWQKHRPLIINGTPLGPADNNTRKDKSENKSRPDPSFEGCKFIVVRGDIITKIKQIGRNELSKAAFDLPQGISAV